MRPDLEDIPFEDGGLEVHAEHPSLVLEDDAVLSRRRSGVPKRRPRGRVRRRHPGRPRAWSAISTASGSATTTRPMSSRSSSMREHALEDRSTARSTSTSTRQWSGRRSSASRGSTRRCATSPTGSCISPATTMRRTTSGPPCAPSRTLLSRSRCVVDLECAQSVGQA